VSVSLCVYHAHLATASMLVLGCEHLGRRRPMTQDRGVHGLSPGIAVGNCEHSAVSRFLGRPD
jgi:hypothetical protein